MNLFYQYPLFMLITCCLQHYASLFFTCSYSVFNGLFYLYCITNPYTVLCNITGALHIIHTALITQSSIIAYVLPVLYVGIAKKLTKFFNTHNPLVIYGIITFFAFLHTIIIYGYCSIHDKAPLWPLVYEILPILVINGIITGVHVYKKQTTARRASA